MMRDRRRLLVALAVLSSAVVGARWLFAPGPAPTSEAEATATAEVPAPPAPLSAAPRRAGRSTADETSAEASAGPSPAEEAAVPSPTGATPPADRIPVRLRLFDAASGAGVAGHWAADESRLSAEQRALQLRVASDPTPDLPTLERFFPRTSEVATVPMRAGRQVQFVISLRGVGEYVLWDTDSLSGALAAGVSDVVVHLPLRRAMALDVAVLDPTGRPAQGATVVAVWVGGARLGGAPWSVNADGIARGRDPLPARRGTGRGGQLDPRSGTAGRRAGAGRRTVRRGAGAYACPRTQLRPLGGDRATRRAPLLHPRPQRIGQRPRGVVRARTIDASDGFAWAARVRVVGIDGRPVARATVTVGPDVGTTAADGTVTVERVLAGDLPVTVRAFGHFPMSGSVRVVADRTTDVELREPVGATLDVLVVNGDGRRPDGGSLRRPHREHDPAVRRDRWRAADDFTDARGRRSVRASRPAP